MFILRPTCTFRYTVVFTTMQSLQNKANKMCVKANIWRQKQPTYLKKKKKKKGLLLQLAAADHQGAAAVR